MYEIKRERETFILSLQHLAVISRCIFIYAHDATSLGIRKLHMDARIHRYRFTILARMSFCHSHCLNIIYIYVYVHAKVDHQLETDFYFGGRKIEMNLLKRF